MRIAMWSGPRNLSTALMRSFGARGDCAISDEPFYAHYLATTGLDHPGREAVIASQPTDWRVVAEALRGPIPGGRALWYQKHMVHHLLPGMGRQWMASVRHAFLIRAPAEVIASYARTRPDPTPEDLGFPQQAALFRYVTEDLGQPAVVIDAADLLADPPRVLQALCAALGIPWTDRMLSWPAGPQPGDGVWGAHWYASVWASTGFEPPAPREVALPPGSEALLAVGEAAHAPLWERRLIAGASSVPATRA